MTDVQPVGQPTSKRRNPLVTAAIVIVGFVVLCGVGLGSCALMIRRGFEGGTFGSPKPIPISVASCPYLRAVHTTAEQAGEGWGEHILTTADTKTWPRFATQLAPKLARFELALRIAIPHVPRPVATDLRDTLGQVRIGRARLPGAKTSEAYLDRTNMAVMIGYSDLADASDLVGNACGFRSDLAPPIPDIPSLDGGRHGG